MGLPLVSILVFVELALDGYCRSRNINNADLVSILVFVELALDGFNAFNIDESMACFNPCFRGTCSR